MVHFGLRCRTPSGGGEYIGFGLRIETGAKSLKNNLNASRPSEHPPVKGLFDHACHV